MSMMVGERTVLPPSQPLEQLASLVTGVLPPRHAELVGGSGERIVLPDEVFEVLRAAVVAMASGQAVTIAPHNQRLTTQEAADLLGISRPTVVRLVERGEIAFEQPGQHRRILLRDVLAYQQRRRHEQRVGLDNLVVIGEKAGMYDATAAPRRTR